jgi:hypothetical protein
VVLILIVVIDVTALLKSQRLIVFVNISVYQYCTIA